MQIWFLVFMAFTDFIDNRLKVVPVGVIKRLALRSMPVCISACHRRKCLPQEVAMRKILTSQRGFRLRFYADCYINYRCAAILKHTKPKCSLQMCFLLCFMDLDQAK